MIATFCGTWTVRGARCSSPDSSGSSGRAALGCLIAADALEQVADRQHPDRGDEAVLRQPVRHLHGDGRVQVAE